MLRSMLTSLGFRRDDGDLDGHLGSEHHPQDSQPDPTFVLQSPVREGSVPKGRRGLMLSIAQQGRRSVRPSTSWCASS